MPEPISLPNKEICFWNLFCICIIGIDHIAEFLTGFLPGDWLKIITTYSLRTTSISPKDVFADAGYRGQNHASANVYISGQTSELKEQQKFDLKQRSAVEPIIGHMKSEGRLRRCRLKGIVGDQIHALLCAVGHNIRKLLKELTSRNKMDKMNVPIRC